MRFSLIVATIGRVSQLERLFVSLAEQEFTDFKVVLVDQNADARLVSLVARFMGKMEIEHLRVPSRGVSAARNAGLPLMGAAEFVAFPDDDCFYDRHTLARAVRVFEAESSAGVVMGSLHLPHEADHLTESGSDAVHRRIRANRMTILRTGGTVVQFFRRSVVDGVGGFDEAIGPGAGTPWLSGEDSDFLVRAFDLGALVVRCTGVRIYHPPVDATFPGYEAKAFGYGRGRVRLLRKNRYPSWFVLANVLHPLVALLYSGPATRGFRWHLFRGRFHEWYGRP
jgi:GT2 family glycosyltransferase